MQILYARDADKDGRHWIYRVVLERDLFDFEHSINDPLLEIDVDELSANADICRQLRRALGRRDVGGSAEFYVIDNVVHKDINWQPYVDTGDGSEPPPVEPPDYQPIVFAVDTDKAQLKGLKEKGTLTANDEKVVIALLLKRS